LCQSRSFPILANDISSRHHIKNLSALLHRSGALVAQKVVYFWDFVSGMSVSDQDIAWVPRPKDLHRIRCFIDSKKDSILLHMSDPHLLFGVVAIAVDPEDRRYRKLVGKKVIIPIINRIVPIVADAAVNAMTFNGIKAVVPCHDRMSLAIAQRHNLPCDVFSVDGYGVFTDHAAIYAGKEYPEFSSNIIQYLQDIHNYDGAESVVIDVPFCKKIQRYVGCFLADGWVMVPDMFQARLVDLVNSDRFVCDQTDKNHIIESLQSIDPLIVSSSHGAVGIAATST
jgi:valyl-tRNA synthetase